ncbi:MAG: peptidoglycan DD-metalloendopeptidase family protein [Armatimonadetes bacterium]|nr:peptidoglycan DD-metalloendopeptidase family protein [Armatimonadota bacterium]
MAILTAGSGGVPELYVVSASGRAVRRCSLQASRLLWSPDGRRLLALAGAPGRPGPLWRLWPGATDQPAQVLPTVCAAVWMPDCRSLVVDEGTGSLSVVDCISGDRAALRCGAGGYGPSVSPDGTQIAFGRRLGGREDLWIMSVDGAASAQLVPSARPQEIAWSPDGRMLAYVEAGASGGQGRLCVVRVAGREWYPLGPARAEPLVWEPGSASLAYSGPDCAMLVEVPSGAARELPDDVVGPVAWSMDGSLTAMRGGALVSLRFGSAADAGRAVAVTPRPVGAILAVAAAPQRPQVAREAQQTAPPVAMGAVPAGELWLSGTVTSTFATGAFQMTVDTMISSALGAFGFGKPPAARVLCAAAAATDGAGPVPPTGGRVQCRLMRSETGLTSGWSLRWVGGEGAAGRGTALSGPSGFGPNVFPVVGPSRWSDTYGAPRDGGLRQHEGQDIMAPRMTPVVALFDGVARGYFSPGRSGFTVSLVGAGRSASYRHLNDDTPGTTDNAGGPAFAFAPGIAAGMRVVAGQLLGWVGDSGNARGTSPHLHLEVDVAGQGTVNPADLLRSARRLDAPFVADLQADPSIGAGEIRYSGCVASVDAAAGVLVLDVAATADRMSASAVKTPLRATVRVPEGASVHAKGAPDVRVALADVQPGTSATVRASGRTGTTLEARDVTVSVTAFLPDPDLRAAMDKAAAGSEPAGQIK